LDSSERVGEGLWLWYWKGKGRGGGKGRGRGVVEFSVVLIEDIDFEDALSGFREEALCWVLK